MKDLTYAILNKNMKIELKSHRNAAMTNICCVSNCASKRKNNLPKRLHNNYWNRYSDLAQC